GARGEGRGLPGPRLQAVLQVAEQPLVETRPPLPGVDELSVFVEPDHERADRRPAVRLECPAADHHLLGEPALRLPPVSPAALAVGRVRALTHDALEAGLARRLEELRPPA